MKDIENKLYGTFDSNPTAMELEHRALARDAAAEGFVLLKNNGALPLRQGKLALYGIGARRTVKGGLGSGSVDERYSVSIEEGLKNAGFEITTGKWLDDYDQEYRSSYEAYRQMVEEKIAGLTDPTEIIPLAHSYVYRYPSGRLVTEEDVRASATDTAVYVLTRQAGEGNDRKLEPGDYYITDAERENLTFLARSYKEFILVVNVGGLIDFGFLDEIEGIDAVVLFVQGGEEGGNALAEVLSGQRNFSGRLTDTIPMRYEDIPFGDTFSHLNGDLDNEYYREGIYVGYRYFDAFAKPVRFPFGFGLSYTDFSMKVKSVALEGAIAAISAEATNIGGVPGREVVQVYLSVPGSGEYQRLAAFAKTGTIAPGGKEAVTLRFSLEAGTVYREDQSAWILHAGDYIVRVGRHSRDTVPAALLRLERDVTVRQCRRCCAPTDVLDELQAVIPPDEHPGVPVLVIDPASIQTETVDYTEPKVVETPEETAILDTLTVLEQAELLRGGDLQNAPAGSLEIHGAAGKTATSLLSKGIRNVIFSDGPAGLNIVNRVRLLPTEGFGPADIPERYNWGALGRGIKARLVQITGPIVYRYATAWPVELLLAQTWDTAVLRRVGEAVGREMAAFGVSVWLSPGMNIHRNPLGGRTFEYYSEDPVVSGELAAALVSGVRTTPGARACIKHLCCNNTEDNRNGISSNVSERALREIYLRGFEIAVRKSDPGAVMTSYNMLNHVYTANRHDLVTDILRCEWGYKGIVMTDWSSCTDHSGKSEMCAPAGNDLVMPGGAWDKGQIRSAISDGRLDAETVRRTACRVLRLMLNSVTSAIIKNEQGDHEI